MEEASESTIVNIEIENGDEECEDRVSAWPPDSGSAADITSEEMHTQQTQLIKSLRTHLFSGFEKLNQIRATYTHERYGNIEGLYCFHCLTVQFSLPLRTSSPQPSPSAYTRNNSAPWGRGHSHLGRVIQILHCIIVLYTPVNKAVIGADGTVYSFKL
jgi:hypothetical protein